MHQRRSTPRPFPKVHPPLDRGKSSRHYERPENATWAKDDQLGEMDSFDLPIQGPRQKHWGDEEEDGHSGEQEVGFGAYKYHRNWV